MGDTVHERYIPASQAESAPSLALPREGGGDESEIAGKGDVFPMSDGLNGARQSA
ncbi:hypothetical protein FRZ61_52100 [Hypericibacter adhaerens]|uniref:Uncharacterized protein n=1 Tax=Hypericibacter adhaerens TaxID=2602016 RepID=A0A5J6N8D3_9PROT|nr:hypothetical protein FRZ61_52100 [Hypericibacter adhaerens]